MQKVKLFSVLFLIAVSSLSYSQKTTETQPKTIKTKVIAVINQANWCAVCKANEERFGNNIRPYSTKGLSIVTNDLTDETTIEKSKSDLQKSEIYKQIYETDRKGLGKMMQVCGMAHGKDKQMKSGVVTFIDAKTLKVLKETSIAISDSEMKSILYNLLKS